MQQRIDTGMDMFNKYIERSDMGKKTYQYDGVKWLLQNELSYDLPCGVRGGFVADEMGLGKTIMMIGLCIANFMHKRKTLIVVPPVLIDQWYAQIYRTTGHRCAVYHGLKKKHFEKQSLEQEGAENVFAGAVIVLCSYDAISVFREKKGKTSKQFGSENTKTQKQVEDSLLHKIQWGRVIFDEAHHLRNKSTTRYVGAKLLRADIKWLVSGTPVQNKKQDFHALCSLIQLPASYYTNPENLVELTESFILKRTKKQVGIDLIDASQDKVVVPWKTTAEKKLSEEIHSLIAFTNVKRVDGDGDGDGDAGGVDNVNNNKILLSLLMKARQSCIYPKMLYKNEKNTNNISNIVPSSSKLDSVVEAILERKNNGNGKLVFCHFKDEMNEIASRLRVDDVDGLGSGLNVAILDGSLSKSMRKKILDEKKDVLILQIQTGCEGLNLQDNYNEVYFVSPHWNPYVEDQAVARCHRIGQKKEVFVWRFEMDNFGMNILQDGNVIPTKNLEEYVMDIQNNKRNIVSKIIVE